MDNIQPVETTSAVKKLSKSLDAIVFKIIRLQDSSNIPELPKGLSDREASVLLVERYFNSQPNMFQSAILAVYYKARHVLVAVLKRILRTIRGSSA